MRLTIPVSGLLIGLASSLAGCGGGEGGLRMPDGPFTSFSAIRPNQVTVMPGMSQTISGSSSNIAAATFDAFDSAKSNMKLTYDSNMSLSAISITAPKSTASFSTALGDTISCASGVCTASSASGARGVVIDATASAIGWNYQTFGVWDNLPTSTTWQAGAISAGAPTPASGVPTSTTPTFTGQARGYYIDQNGALFGTFATMTALVDFSKQRIDLSTSNPTLTSMSGATPPSVDLSLSGSVTNPVGTNQFKIPVSTPSTGPNLSGTASGQFYGPTAQEIGGVYSLSGPGGKMLGGFGGKQ